MVNPAPSADQAANEVRKEFGETVVQVISIGKRLATIRCDWCGIMTPADQVKKRHGDEICEQCDIRHNES